MQRIGNGKAREKPHPREGASLSKKSCLHMHSPRHWLLSISTVKMTDSNNENVLALYFHSKRNKIKSLCATGLTKKERTTHFGQNITLLIVSSAVESLGV